MRTTKLQDATLCRSRPLANILRQRGSERTRRVQCKAGRVGALQGIGGATTPGIWALTRWPCVTDSGRCGCRLYSQNPQPRGYTPGLPVVNVSTQCRNPPGQKM